WRPAGAGGLGGLERAVDGDPGWVGYGLPGRALMFPGSISAPAGAASASAAETTSRSEPFFTSNLSARALRALTPSMRNGQRHRVSFTRRLNSCVAPDLP